MPQRSNPNTRPPTGASRSQPSRPGARSVPPAQRGNIYRPPPLSGGFNRAMPQPARPLPPLVGPRPPVPQRPNFPPPAMGGPKVFNTALPSSPHDRPATGKSVDYAHNVWNQILASRRPSLTTGIVSGASSPSGPIGASGGAPQMAYNNGGVPQRVPTNPMDAMGAGEIRNQAYQAMQATRVGMMPYLSPWGRQIALNTPFEMAYRGHSPAGYGGYYYSGPNRITMFNANPANLRHEYGHAFGFNQSPFGLPAGFSEAVNQMPDAYRMERNFPGMFGNPYKTMPGGEQWGGPTEYYAQTQMYPQAIPPDLQQFYPQFNQNAFHHPGYEWRWVTFEDGSSGWTYAPVTP